MSSKVTSSKKSSTSNRRFLVNFQTGKQIPLYAMKNEIVIENNIAVIKYIQYYYNDSSSPVFVEYVFPSFADCTFTKFEMRLQGKTVVSEVRQKEAAKAIFEEAKRAGDIPIMAHPCKAAQDMNIVQIGNLPPKSPVILTCYFHQLLDVQDLSWRLHIPSKVTPRYLGNTLKYVEYGAHLKGMVEEILSEEEKEEK
mmetsp:Transcript_15733/g.18191  ORF Transcript_15733/g.18191 Transcript_15733/m.18191 type:complete len:196 (-) Transcript_15733:2341-2928(-)